MAHSLSPMIPDVVENCPELTEKVPAERWSIEKVFPSLSDMTVMVIGPNDGRHSAILYLPRTERAIADLERRKRVMSELFADTRLSDLWSYLPRILHEGSLADRPYWITSRLQGIGLETSLTGNRSGGVMRSAAEVLSILHHKTAQMTTIDDDFLGQWVISPIQIILNSPLTYYHRKSHVLLKKLELQLSEVLRGAQVVTCRVHGDFWPNNILISSDHKHVTGIVDWDLSKPVDLPSMDLINFLLSSSREIQRKELGQLIVEIHKSAAWGNTAIQEIWDSALQKLHIRMPTLQNSLLIFWIRHLEANLKKSRWYSTNPLWAIKNYQHIMNYLETVP